MYLNKYAIQPNTDISELNIWYSSNSVTSRVPYFTFIRLVTKDNTQSNQRPDNVFFDNTQ